MKKAMIQLSVIMKERDYETVFELWSLLKSEMLKQIAEMVIAGIVIFVGIGIAIGLLILIVSSFEDFFFGIKNSGQE